MPLLKKEGHTALQKSVGISDSVGLVSCGLPHLLQLITGEQFAPETSNLVGI